MVVTIDEINKNRRTHINEYKVLEALETNSIEGITEECSKITE